MNELATIAYNLVPIAFPAFLPRPFGLLCPNCGLRSMAALGSRVYRCENPDCPGEPGQELGPFVSMLTVDALSGVRLLPWEEVTARDRLRKTDPRGFLRSVAKEGGALFGRRHTASAPGHTSAGGPPREPALPPSHRVGGER